MTFNFAPSVNATTGLPEVMEVAVLPLTDASSAPAGATFAGGLRTATVELVHPGPNPAVFDLIPSYSPGLNTPIMYRVMWRAGVLGRTYSYDFAMPDVDCTWEELVAGLGEVIDGDAYLQQTDLGVPGRVARLDDAGHVIDSAGNAVMDAAAYEIISANLVVERIDRQQAVTDLRRILEDEMYLQDSTNLNLAYTYTDNQITSVNADLTIERGARINADDDLQSQITSLGNSTGIDIDALQVTVGEHTDTLLTKADLDGDGKILLSQIPESVAANAYAVPDQTAMLALSFPAVHRGDVVVRPDGVWLLTTNSPSELSSWISLTTVSAVNNKRGNVSLSAADVGAIPTGGSIAQSQVTGLATALGLKANQADLTTVAGQVSSILSDATLVHTSAGVIPSTLLDSNMVYLNSYGQLVKKDGTIIPVGGGGGGGAVFSVNTKTGTVVLTAADVGAIPTGGSVTISQVTGLSAALAANIPQSQVTGLVSALAAKADLTGGLIPLAEIPTMPTTKITGLATILANNLLDGTSNAINRIATLEGQILGGGGEGGVSTQVPFYTSSNVTTPVTDFTLVNLHSPWGIDSDGTVTGTINTWYYEYEGVRSQDVAYPYITQNGHLQLNKWNEAGPSEPVYALASDVTTLTSTVGNKANQSDLTALGVTVATKANQTDLTALSSTVDGKASAADLGSLATTVSGKASQADLTNTNAVVATKANQTDLSTLTSTVNTKASSADLTTAQGNISTINTTLTHKADLDGGSKVPLAQLPSQPISQITGLSTALTGKADLSGGVLAAAQIPTAIPQSSITGLGTALGAKADLVGGTVPLSQLPQAALPNVQTKVNRAGMLALTSADVQYGDMCLITATADKGTYVLTGNDPSQFSNWTSFALPDAPVASVNTRTGAVVLTYTDVGAMAANATPAASSASPGSTLATQLATFATSATVTSGLAAKASYTDLQNMWFQSSMVKHADYVATSPIASLSMQQSADSVLMPNNAIVLLTAQADSTNNGLWTVNSSGAWTRPTDYANASFVARDTAILVSNTTASANGTNNPHTVWQMTTTSGFIGTNTTTWTKIGYCSPPFAPAAGNGITITGGNTFASKVANTSTKNGILLATEGLYLDPNLAAKKFIAANPSTALVQGISHNLNNWYPSVTIWDTSSHTLVLAGVQATSADAISIEFGSAPSAGQYQITCIG